MATVTAAGTGAAGLATPTARWALGFAWCCGVAKGVIEGQFDADWFAVTLALAILLAGAWVLTYPKDRPLSGLRAWAVPTAAIGATALALSSVNTAERLWLIDYAAYLIGLQIARGNSRIGLTTGAIQVGLCVVWGLTTSQPTRGLLAMIALPVVCCFVGLTWRLVLRYLVARERAYLSASATSERESVAARSAAEQFSADLAAVRDEVSNLLTRIRDGAELDDELQVKIASQEGTIRDRLRAPQLQHPQLIAAAVAARERGVSVTMLAEDTPTIQDSVAQAIARSLDLVLSGAAVISSSPRTPGLVSLVVSDETRSERTDYHADF